MHYRENVVHYQFMGRGVFARTCPALWERHLPRDFMTTVELAEAGEWGIWYAGVAYTVGHFLKTLGPDSEVWRFPTRQAAQQAILDRWIDSGYVARMIPKSNPLPGKS